MDGEFIVSRQRTISVGVRFPATFGNNSPELIDIAWHEGRVVGACAAKDFLWSAAGRIWRGSMIGFVCVEREMQRQGIGTALVRSCLEGIRSRNRQFAVLWSSKHMFYSRFGWMLHDLGATASISGGGAQVEEDAVKMIKLGSGCAATLEKLRDNLGIARVVRTPEDYQTIPIPAAEVNCMYVPGQHGDIRAYALLGVGREASYLYEAHGEPEAVHILCSAVKARHKSVIVNWGKCESGRYGVEVWGSVEWKSQTNAMFQWLANESCPIVTESWHIPYYDWI